MPAFRFDGVVPKDTESREILADDAHENAMSYGRPAGRIALLGLDLAVATLTFLSVTNSQAMPRLSIAVLVAPVFAHNFDASQDPRALHFLRSFRGNVLCREAQELEQKKNTETYARGQIVYGKGQMAVIISRSTRPW